MIAGGKLEAFLHEFSLAQISTTTTDIVVDYYLVFTPGFQLPFGPCREGHNDSGQSSSSGGISWIYSDVSAEMALVLSERVFSPY